MDTANYLNYNLPYQVNTDEDDGGLVVDTLLSRKDVCHTDVSLNEAVNEINLQPLLSHHVKPDYVKGYLNAAAVATVNHSENLARVEEGDLEAFQGTCVNLYDNYQRRISNHPSQPVMLNFDGSAFFKPNRMVQQLVQQAGLAMDTIVERSTPEDVAQVQQLLGSGTYGWSELYAPNDIAKGKVERERLYAKMANAEQYNEVVLLSPRFLNTYSTPVFKYAKPIEDGVIHLTPADYSKHKRYMANESIYLYLRGDAPEAESYSGHVGAKWADIDWNYWEIDESLLKDISTSLSGRGNVRIPYTALPRYSDYLIAAIFTVFKQAEILIECICTISTETREEVWEAILKLCRGDCTDEWPMDGDNGKVDNAIRTVKELVTTKRATYVYDSSSMSEMPFIVTDAEFKVSYSFCAMNDF